MAKYDKENNKVYHTVDAFIADNFAQYASEGALAAMYDNLPNVSVEFDSSTDTLKHIKRVNQLLLQFCIEMQKRAIVHDNSKLENPEKAAFDKMTPLLAGVTYGSDEYKTMLAQIRPAIDHHQQNNSHHPEFYKNGVDGMDLFDLVEMFFDWKAAGERHNDGNIYRSIEHNKNRFAMSEQLCNIFANTAIKLGYKKP